jgi:hypothetical protein
MVWQQHHGARPLGHVDSRRLGELLRSLFVEDKWGKEDGLTYLNTGKDEMKNTACP